MANSSTVAGVATRLPWLTTYVERGAQLVGGGQDGHMARAWLENKQNAETASVEDIYAVYDYGALECGASKAFLLAHVNDRVLGILNDREYYLFHANLGLDYSLRVCAWHISADINVIYWQMDDEDVNLLRGLFAQVGAPQEGWNTESILAVFTPEVCERVETLTAGKTGGPYTKVRVFLENARQARAQRAEKAGA